MRGSRGPEPADRPDNLAAATPAPPTDSEIEEVVRGAPPPALALAAPTREGWGAPAPGATTEALSRVLVPLRAGDPLGLGVTPGTRPPAPPDPDPYDRERENAAFARSFLSPEERRALDAEIEQEGFMTIEKVRALVSDNTVKGSVEAGGLDPEVMALLDARIDYKIFIAGDNIYTRSELYDHFPFHELDVQPEAIFVQQEIGIFPPRKHALKGDLEYVARDVGDDSVEFIALEDLVGQAARAGYRAKRAPMRVAQTKIYIGKERWEDFLVLQRVYRATVRIATAQIAYGDDRPGRGSSPLLALLAGRRPGGDHGNLLTDQATLDAERRAREEELVRREAELRRREEEQRRHEEEQRRQAAALQERLDRDLRRLEDLFAAAPARAPPAPPGAVPPPAPAGGPAGDDDDSVPL